MRILLGVIIALLLVPSALAADMTVQGVTTTEQSNNFDVDIYVGAPEIIGFELDLQHTAGVTYVDHVYYDGQGSPIVDFFQCTNTSNGVVITANSVEGLACVTTIPGGNGAGVYVKITFSADSAVQTTFTPTNSIITNSTNIDASGYSGIVENIHMVTITPVGFSYGNAVLPSQAEIDTIVNVTYPITFVNPGTLNVFPPADYPGNVYWLDNGSRITAVPPAGGGQIQLTLVAGQTYTLIAEVDTPSYIQTFENSGAMYEQHFSLTGTAVFSSVYGEVPVNASYPYWQLWQDNGTGWVNINIPANLTFNPGTGMTGFRDITAGDEDFRLFGNMTCLVNYVVVNPWSTCDSTSNSQYRFNLDINYCNYPYTQYTTQTCGTTEPPDDPPRPPPGGCAPNCASEEEFTTVTTYDSGDVLETTVTYLAFGESTFTVTANDFDIGVGTAYTGFDLDSSLVLTPEKISNVQIKFDVNDFWMENNGVTDIEVYQLEETGWIRLSTLNSGGTYTTFTTSIGSFAVVGFIPDIDEQRPDEIPVTNPGGNQTNSTVINPITGPLQQFLIPGIIGLLVIAAIIGGVVMHARHPAKHGQPKKVVHDKMDKLGDYVKKARSAGLDNTKIRENLKRVGWTEEVVNKYVKP